MVVLPAVSPPLPIPNRAVKPAMADGTAPMWRGRVGSRHFIINKTSDNLGGFFMHGSKGKWLWSLIDYARHFGHRNTADTVTRLRRVNTGYAFFLKR